MLGRWLPALIYFVDIQRSFDMATSTTSSTGAGLMERLPVTPLGKFIGGVGVLLGLGALSGAIAIGMPGGIALATMSVIYLLLAAAIFAGLRWAPIVGTLLSAGGLGYTFFGTPYPIYHLTHLQDPLFAPLVLAVALSALIFAAMVAAVVQNYGVRERRVPRWFAFIATGLAGMALGAILIGVSAKPETVSAATASDGAVVVHLGLSTFSPMAITVPPGGKLEFVDDANIPHQLTYGVWNNGRTQVATPANAPALNNRTISSGSFEIGPFTTAGTYHILCVIHPGMELTVTVP
jgi:plastocyanin